MCDGWWSWWAAHDTPTDPTAEVEKLMNFHRLRVLKFIQIFSLCVHTLEYQLREENRRWMRKKIIYQKKSKKAASPQRVYVYDQHIFTSLTASAAGAEGWEKKCLIVDKSFCYELRRGGEWEAELCGEKTFCGKRNLWWISSSSSSFRSRFSLSQ